MHTLCFKFAVGSPAADHFLLYGQKKVTKLICQLSAAPGSPALRAQVFPCLRYSIRRAAAELAPRKARGPQTVLAEFPGASALLSGLHGDPQRRFVAILAASIFLVSLPDLRAALAAETSYPTRPIRLIVPQSPGGTTDYTARLIGPRLAERLGQGVVVDNRPGAGSMLGIDLAAKAAPDGYTLLLAATTLGIMPAMVKQLPFDPLRDFAPITTLTVYPNLVVVHPSVQATSIKELIALAKARPGALNFASGGTGTGTQLTAELFKTMAGIHIVHVPYKGGGPAMTALLGGEVQLYFGAIPSTLPFVRAGRLRALAVSSAKRSPAAPEVPSMAESGLTGYDEVTWNGLVAPARIPPHVQQRLYGNTVAVLKLPAVREKLAAEGAEPGGLAPDAFARLIRAEVVKWAKVIREAGIKAE